MRPKGTTYQSPKALRLAMARIVSRRIDGSENLPLPEFRARVWALAQLIPALELEQASKPERSADSLAELLEHLAAEVSE